MRGETEAIEAQIAQPESACVARVGDYLHVSGVTAWDHGMAGDGIIDAGMMDTGTMDTCTQTLRCCRHLQHLLQHAGLGLDRVVRLRLYLARGADREQALLAWNRVFAGCHPVTAVIEVERLLRPQILVELEADAWTGAWTGARTKTTQISN